jgi:TIR domain
MKVFIGWSGERSKTVALELRRLIQRVIQAAEPWMSEMDIPAGSRWRNQLNKQLADTTYGIIVVTAENVRNPWINFEAGALAKSVKDDNFVCPYLVDVSDAEVTGPLTDFQAKKATKEETLTLFRGINDAQEKKLPDDLLSETFAHFWPILEGIIKSPSAPTVKKEPRKDRELLEEILGRLKSLDRDIGVSSWVPENDASLRDLLAFIAARNSTLAASMTDEAELQWLTGGSHGILVTPKKDVYKYVFDDRLVIAKLASEMFGRQIGVAIGMPFE